MNSTAVPTQNQAAEYRTNGTTGKAFRPGGNPDRISKRKARSTPLPERFQVETNPFVKYKRRSSARKLLAHGCKGHRLIRHHGFNSCYFYTLDARELGADRETAAWLEDSANYDNEAVGEAWVRLLDRAFPNQPYAYGLHVGDCGRIGAHVMAGSENAIPNPTAHRDPKRRKHIGNTNEDYVRVLAYIKAKQPPTGEGVRNYRTAVKAAGGARHLSQKSGIRGFRAVKRVRKPSKNIVGDGVGKKVVTPNGAVKTPSTMTLQGFESIVFAGSRGTIRRSWTPTGPPVRGSP